MKEAVINSILEQKKEKRKVYDSQYREKNKELCDRVRREYYAKNKDRFKEKRDTRYIENKEEYKTHYIKNREKILTKIKLDSFKRHNITAGDYDRMLKEQNHCCKICYRHKSEFKKGLGIDHDHKTGKVRGLLCTPCNISLGYMKDNIQILQSAIDYLKYSNNG